MLSLVEVKKISIVVNVFSLLRISPENKVWPSFEQTLKDALCQVLLKLSQRFWRRRILLLSLYFAISLSCFLAKKHSPLFEQTWIYFTQELRLVENSPAVLDFFQFCKFIFTFHYYLRLEKGVVLHSNKTEISLPKGTLYQISLKLAHELYRRRILNFVNLILLFRYYLPLDSFEAFRLSRPQSPSPKNYLVKVWLKISGFLCI